MSNTLQVSAPSLLRVHDSGRSRKNASSVVGVRARRATVSCKSCSMVILHLRPPATIADRGFHYRKRRDHTGEVRDSAAILARPINGRSSSTNARLARTVSEGSRTPVTGVLAEVYKIHVPTEASVGNRVG